MQAILEKEITLLKPRLCDCQYCQSLEQPSALISDKELITIIDTPKNNLVMKTNGSGQATFYHCKKCDQLIAVGALIDGELRGAVNSCLFTNTLQFKPPEFIQPYRLTAEEKIQRWSLIWGKLEIKNNT